MSSDDAVSPVVSVILLVAIVVVLSTVVFSFVGGIGNEQTSSSAGITVESNESSVKMNVIDMGTSEQIEFTNGTETKTVSSVGESVVFNGTDPVQVVGQNGQSSSLIRTVKPTDEGVVNNEETTTGTPDESTPENSPPTMGDAGLQPSAITYFNDTYQVATTSSHVYLNNESELSKVSRSTGNVEWTTVNDIDVPQDFENPTYYQGVSIADDGTVYSTEVGEVTRYDSNGNPTPVSIPSNVTNPVVTDDRNIYGYNLSSDEFVFVDLDTNKIENTVSLAGKPNIIKEGPNGNYMYVQTNEDEATNNPIANIYKISKSTLTVEDTYTKNGIITQPGTRGGELLIDGNQIFTELSDSTGPGSERLVSLSTTDMSEQWLIKDNYTFNDLSVGPNGNLYASGGFQEQSQSGMTYMKIDTTSGTVTEEFRQPTEGPAVSNAVIDVKGDTLYANSGIGIFAYDTDGMKVAWVEQEISKPPQTGIVVDGDDIYVSNHGSTFS